MSDFGILSGRDEPRAALLYARVSTARQAEREISIPDQFYQMRNYCAENGIMIAGEYQDAHTGRELNRQALSEMRAHIEAFPGQVQFVLVHSFSRLNRDMVEFELMKREFEAVGTKIVSITQHVENSEIGDLVRRVYNIIDEYNSRETAKHVKRSMKKNARDGFHNGGIAPFGYRPRPAGVRGDTVKKKLEKKPSEAADVALIFQLYLVGDGTSGPLGVKNTTHWLNKNGYLRRGKAWTTGCVHKVLTNPIYVGRREFRSGQEEQEKIFVSVPSIITEAQFQQVQERLRSRHWTLTAPRTANSPILLTGTACCGICGGFMILRTGKGGRYRYYTCSNHARKGKAVCRGQSVPMDVLDSAVVDKLTAAVSDPDRIRKVLEVFSRQLETRNADERSQAAELRREHQEREGAVSRLYSGVESGLFDPNDAQFRAMFSRARDELEIVRAKLELLSKRRRQRAEIAEDKVEAFIRFLIEKLRRGPMKFRKAYLRAYVNKVVVNGASVQLVPKTADRGR